MLISLASALLAASSSTARCNPSHLYLARRGQSRPKVCSVVYYRSLAKLWPNTAKSSGHSVVIFHETRAMDQNNFYPGFIEAWSLGLHASPMPAYSISDETSVHNDKIYIIHLYVPICCDGHEEKVYKKLKRIDGVASVNCDRDKKKVTVRGTAVAEVVLKTAQKILSSSTLWVQ